MNATTILLAGDPKAEPSFLAVVEPAIFHTPPPFTLPFELLLDSYTREPWSSGKINHSHNDWQCCYLVSTDGKKRLSGFVQYLQERKKAAVAKFDALDILPPSSTPACGKAILVVPYDPPPMPTELALPKDVDKSEVIFVKYLRDENILKRDDTRDVLEQQKMMQERQRYQQQQQQQNPTQHDSQQRQTQTKLPTGQQHAQQPSSSKKGGCLGKLLGAQRRTENHLDMVRTKKGSNNHGTFDPNTGAAGCINQFRNKILNDLQLFKSDPTKHATKISISHTSLIKNVPLDEQDRVTFNVFKFAVYEQVEEVGMGRWVAAKEPSEFLDECVITVYKHGHCPADVLDEINRGDLPDEIKGQARHMVESQSKAIVRKGKKHDEQMVKDTIVGEDNVAVVLNTNKRDRRTLEQIQKDLQGESEDAKRGRFV